jgi:hypothetical protein
MVGVRAIGIGVGVKRGKAGESGTARGVGGTEVVSEGGIREIKGGASIAEIVAVSGLELSTRSGVPAYSESFSIFSGLFRESSNVSASERQ